MNEAFEVLDLVEVPLRTSQTNDWLDCTNHIVRKNLRILDANGQEVLLGDDHSLLLFATVLVCFLHGGTLDLLNEFASRTFRLHYLRQFLSNLRV